jgi:tyrosyl-tRNA synthetase
MKFFVEPEVFEQIPELVVGLVQVKGLDNTKACPKLHEALDEAVAASYEQVKESNLHDMAQLQPYRNAMKNAGINPNKYPCSIEALLKRIQKQNEFPHISDVVDLGNMISLKYKMPVGAHALNEDQTLAIRSANETLAAANPDEKDALKTGEIVYAVDDEVRTRRWIWRQSAAGRMDESIDNVIYPIDGTSENIEEVKKALEELAELAQKRFGAEVKTGLVSKEMPEWDFEGNNEKKKDWRDYSMENMTLFDELQWRGLIDNITSEDVIDEINNGELTFYIGTDPTADSLHIGHYSSLLMAKRLQQHGHHPIMLVGGATGFIGDPKASGERNMLTQEVLQKNYEALHNQISKLWGFEMVNNLDWTKDISIIDFLRDYGKYFNVNYMINKETVKKRLDSGISYTEFSYMILQSLDFLHLLEEKGCRMQIGGQDQWGNITSGLELIRKKLGNDVKAYGVTMPLITKADGTKFGKSESGTVWLDASKTSPYALYQFLFNTDDVKVIEYLKKLTFLTKEEIDALEVSVKEEPHLRKAQTALATEVVRDLHGEEGLASALKITEALFRGKLDELDEAQRRDAIADMEKKQTPAGSKLEDVLVGTKIASSKREAREWIKGNSIAINGKKVTDPNQIMTKDDAYVDAFMLVRRGKKNNYCVELIEQ